MQPTFGPRALADQDPTTTIDGVTYYRRICEWCMAGAPIDQARIRADEPVAHVVSDAETYRVHRECGRQWIENKRANVADLNKEAGKIRDEIEAYREDDGPTPAMELVTTIRAVLLRITTETEPLDAVHAADTALSTLHELTRLVGWEPAEEGPLTIQS